MMNADSKKKKTACVLRYLADARKRLWIETLLLARANALVLETQQDVS